MSVAAGERLLQELWPFTAAQRRRTALLVGFVRRKGNILEQKGSSSQRRYASARSSGTVLRIRRGIEAGWIVGKSSSTSLLGRRWMQGRNDRQKVKAAGLSVWKKLL
ncbi:hypothetical protein MLD38_037590 [Melastoma candidum]|uniref:Uncharacterized protein n=1 Tax=Melastoma candidum TaxID=119954 RepID=A0ACB9LNY2_9MYRT|nr:hypothetical protein MLD38_037590 [Melastoma candidum]